MKGLFEKTGNGVLMVLLIIYMIIDGTQSKDKKANSIIRWIILAIGLGIVYTLITHESPITG